MLDNISMQIDGSERISTEYKTVAIVFQLSEMILRNSILEKKYDIMVESINTNFIEYIEKILPKYFSQSFNTEEIIDNSFRIYFGVADDGHVIGFPIIDKEHMIQMIYEKIEKTLTHIMELSVMKFYDSQIIDSDIMYIDDTKETENSENSYTYTYSKSYTNGDAINMDIKKLMEKTNLLKIDIELTPVAELACYSSELEPDLRVVLKEYDEKITNYNKYKTEKDLKRQIWIDRSLYVKTSLNIILNTERRYEFLIWLKFEACKTVDSLDLHFPNLASLIEELEKKTDGTYNNMELDYKLINAPDNIASEKRTDYEIMKLVTMYRDIIGNQLRNDAHLYKMEPMVPPPAEPYTNICSCYIGSVMNDIGKTYPLYVCSITIGDVKNFLKNVTLKHFYYENECGIPICQIRKIDIVSGTTVGPISVDKNL